MTTSTSGAAGRALHPYGDAANLYYSQGWRGVLPLPAGSKYPPPNGYTGAGGIWASGADVWTWAEDTPDANVALRLPPNVIGIDVDAYDEKDGSATLAEATRRWGKLPPTYVSTSRDDDISGIYLYRVPEGLHWPGEVGPHIEIVQTRHRYAVVAPSMHPEGRPYQWYGPDGERVGVSALPKPAAIPELPQKWITGLTLGRLAVDIAKADVDDAALTAWASSTRNSALTACGAIRSALVRAQNDLAGSASARHDTGLRAVMRIVRLSTEGHCGAVPALAELRALFTDAITTGTSARSRDDADSEWLRLMHGALAVIAADGQLGPCDLADPCVDVFDGILMPDARDGSTLAYEQQQYTGDSATLNAGDVGAYELDVERELYRQQVRAEAKRRQLADDAKRSWRAPAPIVSVRELIEQPDEDTDWQIDEIMPTGANVVLVAAAKTGKTTTVGEVVRCLVDERPVFGRYATSPLHGAASLWNYEVGASMYRRWVRDIGIERDDRVFVWNLRGTSMPLTIEAVRSLCVETLQETNTSVWVVDPFARALIGNASSENDNSEIGAFLDLLDEIKSLAGVRSLIIPTHASRMDSTPGMERSRGASRLEDWCDVRWYLSRDKEGGRFFRASGRDVETEEEQLVMDPVSRRLELQPGERATNEQSSRRPTANDGDVLNAIVDVIDAAPGIGVRGLRRQVVDRVATRAVRVDAMVQRLIEQGLVLTEVGSGNMLQHFTAAQMRGQ